MPNKVWDEITDQLPNVNCATVGIGKQAHPTFYNIYNYFIT